jgi:two-component system KDP operon response regulator KdpE
VGGEPEGVALLTFAFERAGFAVAAAAALPEALRLLRDDRPDVAVVDVDLGPGDGPDALTALRRRSALPVLVLSARAAEDDVVRALDRGADDYVTKPFGYRELLARVRAVLRRSGRPGPGPAGGGTLLRAGPVTLDVVEQRTTNGGQPVQLTPTEFRVLRCLMQRAGAVVPTGELVRQVWGAASDCSKELVRTAISRLRRKLRDDPAHPRLVHTVPGVGFALRPAGPPA